MQRLNPTGSLLRARSFVARHDYIFALLCLLNVNMGALNTSALLLGNGESATVVQEEGVGGTSVIGETPMDLSLEMVLAQGLLDDMAGVYKRVKCFSRSVCFGIFFVWFGACPGDSILRKPPPVCKLGAEYLDGFYSRVVQRLRIIDSTKRRTPLSRNRRG